MIQRNYSGREFFRDERDYVLTPTTSRRKRRMWRDTFWAGDQGGEPACVGYAWTHWLANVPLTQLLDPLGIYHLAQHLDEWEGTDYEGTSVRAGAKVLSSLGFVTEYRFTWDLPTLVDILLEAGPVVVGTDWLAGMDRPDAEHVIHATGCTLGGHAYLLNGVDARKGLVRLKNSWGNGWGENGRAWLPFDDLEKLLGRDGECCLATERRPAP